MEPFSKRECAECQQLDHKLREYLASLPKDLPDEPVKDPSPYMCAIHLRLFRARVGGKLIPMPMELVLPKMQLRAGENGEPDLETEFPALDGAEVTVRARPGALNTYEVSVLGTTFESVTDVGLQDGVYIFHEPWIMTEAFWRKQMKGEVPPEARAALERYHAIPITYDDDIEAGKVQVYCEPPHVDREGRRCTARVTDAEEHHVVCPKCGVEVKLWEYAVGPSQEEASAQHAHP